MRACSGREPEGEIAGVMLDQETDSQPTVFGYLRNLQIDATAKHLAGLHSQPVAGNQSFNLPSQVFVIALAEMKREEYRPHSLALRQLPS